MATRQGALLCEQHGYRMKLRSSTKLGLGAIGALMLLASIVGCSASNQSGSPWDDSGNPGGNADDGGGVRMDGTASGSGGGSGGSSSSSGGGSSGASSSGASGSSSGGSSSAPDAGSGADAGNHGGADASGISDAAGSQDSGATPDTGSAGGDAGSLCADQAVWLTPMNQARAMLNVGEPDLVCDPRAVQVALNYARQCQAGATPGMLVHNMNRNAQYMALGGTGGLGENIAAGAPTQTPGQAVALWLSEGSSYNYANNTCSGTCGHYTQVVWKATTGAGCAHATCNSNFFGGGTWEFNVCDYSPPGNYVGQRPY